MAENNKKTALVSDIILEMETLAPVTLAEKWDNVGLQIGQRDWKINRVWISLDPLNSVINAACKQSIDMLITHHPIFLNPIKAIDFSTPMGKVIQMAVNNKLVIYSAHTNLDSAAGGINDLLAEKIGLENVKAFVKPDNDNELLEEQLYGLGRIGDLIEPLSLGDLAVQMKYKLNVSSIKYAGDPKLLVKKVAVCSGSGSSLMKRFFLSDSNVYVSGDLKYHDARDVEAAERGLIDIGHFASEHLMIEYLANHLQDRLSKKGYPIKIEACDLESDPFQIV